ncbi:DMT family transporter [Peribacillus saganii]|uniref:DMT family transporter n=1 Tax=Peribacillus saganii TaxID=2303992 RepID=A0A372LRC5_9BACI|nr:DMT family transporter [Peribacillus saganii]RFU70773.1 DMT family transporter [Peribacillus saganii]
MQKPAINPYLALAIGVASVSISAIFVKLSTAPSGVIAFYRLFFSVLLMLPVFLIKYGRELKHIQKRDWLFTIVSGVFLAFHFILWFESLEFTSIASSTVLVTLQPLFAFAGAYLFFHERFSMNAIISGIIAIIGSVIISWGDFRISGQALVGDILALAACGLITAYLLFGQTVRKRISLITYTFLVYSVSTATIFVYVLVNNEPLYPYPLDDWIYFLLLAVFPTLLGHSIFNWVVKWISATTVSIVILFEPVGATLLAYLILEEKLVWSQVAGGLIVLIGILLFLRGREINNGLKKMREAIFNKSYRGSR